MPLGMPLRVPAPQSCFEIVRLFKEKSANYGCNGQYHINWGMANCMARSGFFSRPLGSSGGCTSRGSFWQVRKRDGRLVVALVARAARNVTSQQGPIIWLGIKPNFEVGAACVCIYCNGIKAKN